MQTRYKNLLKYVVGITDLLTLNIVYWLALIICHYLGKWVSSELFQQYVVICNVLWLFNALFSGLYTGFSTQRLEKVYRITWRCILSHFVLFTIFLLYERDAEFSRTFIIVFYTGLILAFAVNRFFITVLQLLLVKNNSSPRKVAVIGMNPFGNKLGEHFELHPNIDFYGFIGKNENSYDHKTGLLSEVAIAEMEAAATDGVTELYISIHPEKMDKIHILLREATKYCLPIKLVPDITGTLRVPFTLNYLDNEFPIIKIRQVPLEDVTNRLKKRIVDILFSSAIIILLFSWLFPIFALIIKKQSKGPILSRCKTSGINQQLFDSYRFRSTHSDGSNFPFGNFMRRTGIDKLPQFFNVLAGEMSLVGPRPNEPGHSAAYKELIDQFMIWYFAKPGITGWSQVKGFSQEIDGPEALANQVRLDVWYLENWSTSLDLKIIVMSIVNALLRKS